MANLELDKHGTTTVILHSGRSWNPNWFPMDNSVWVFLVFGMNCPQWHQGVYSYWYLESFGLEILDIWIQTGVVFWRYLLLIESIRLAVHVNWNKNIISLFMCFLSRPRKHRHVSEAAYIATLHLPQIYLKKGLQIWFSPHKNNANNHGRMNRKNQARSKRKRSKFCRCNGYIDRILSSLKRTFSHLKLNGWNTTFLFWDGQLLGTMLLSGRIIFFIHQDHAN